MTNKAKEQAEERNIAAAAKCREGHSFPPKLTGWELYKSLGSPKHVVAPMVDQSELAWRILSRRYNADLCYTPMFNAKLFAKEEKYREEHWTGLKQGLGSGGPNDRPLVVQFCANDPEYLLQAALMVAPYCDAIDINLGCPQHIARRGHYGSFLMEDWPLIASLISTLHKHLPIPVTAKIRVFPEVEKTIEYAKMVVEAGAQILVVHGRLREMKGHLTGIADWEKIRLVQEAVSHQVPVIANGNILYYEDVARCLEKTGCAGVMSAEGNLYNPAIFTPGHPEAWKLAEEYLTICNEVDTKLAYIRGHLFKIFRPALNIYTDMRAELGMSSSLEKMWDVTRRMKDLLIRDAETSRMNGESFEGRVDDKGYPILPHWLSQPYFRPPLAEPKAKQPNSETADSTATSAKRTADESAHRDDDGDAASVKTGTPSTQQKKVKKTKVLPNLCHNPGCLNTFSAKCSHQRCKNCCRHHQQETNTFDCEPHVIRVLKAQQQEQPPVSEQKLDLPRVDSQEAIGAVALEGMVSPTPPLTDSLDSINSKHERCTIL
ncbi:hypothetical protein BGW38_001487 [Lunasporangiospora selenospora]|uniref:tRNA-dihydrouridine(16/17) synthase [NAD(P)(+)] n=1 Tax=Lunasporangiospora selenospora TaxID=979761 RepID=A0A9P6FUK3_9FUNG|nr:hypothetical protein BGW38_001487 [Lunasporangiospora selenospora]